MTHDFATLLLSVSPTVALQFSKAILGGVAAWIPETVAGDIVGKKLLPHEVSGIIMGIFVVCAVAEVFHQ